MLQHQMHDDNAALTTDGKISNTSCRLWLLCRQVTMKADKISISAPEIPTIADSDGDYITQLQELNKPETASSL
ncbi:hypothetical protein TN98_01440 [Pantoea anthophila]|nr:hypothetical protein TN98_01440 [Pantoea anthophila]